MENNKHTKSETFVYAYHLDVEGKSSIPTSKIDSNYIEYRRQWEMNPRNKIVSDFPLHLDIEPTGRCNLMCKHCYRFSRRTNIDDMDMELFKKIIDEGKKYNLSAINLSWMGEPFLHPKIMEMLDYAKSQKVLDIFINTNGTLIDKEMTKKILDSGSINTIIFSLDSITEEKYNRVKYGSDFKLVNQNINYLIELKERRGLSKPKIIVQMIDQKQTHEELMAFIYHWRTRADRVRISTYQSPDGKLNDKMRSRSPPEIMFPCPQLWQRLVIAWDGTVYPCLGDNACRESLGNVKETSIYSIWHGDRLNYLRKKHTKLEADDIEMCSHCDLNKIPKIANNYGKDTDKGGN